MDIREALLRQSPSLALQRSAADEIARLDGEIRKLAARTAQLSNEIVLLKAATGSLATTKE